jgi:hypothetical protein
MRFTSILITLVAAFSCLTNSTLTAEDVAIVLDRETTLPVEHGITQIEQTFLDQGFSTKRCGASNDENADFFLLAGIASMDGEAVEILNRDDIELPELPESLVIHLTTVRDKPTIVLCGSDERALMYAALDTAERIASANGSNPFELVYDVAETPFVAERAVSTYTMHRKHFENRLYNEAYWNQYFDMLAASRINSFVIVFGYENGGFMAPVYPFFFDVDEFPDVELVGISKEEQEKNTVAFQRMIEIAHSRGIEITAAIWDHIYRGGVQGGGIDGASDVVGQRTPGLVYGVDSDNLTSYNKIAINQFLDVFPELDGLQFRMHGESGLKRDEMAGFWHEVFAMIRLKHPDMRIDLRAKQLPDTIIQDGLEQGLRIRVATKYWMEQMGMPFHPTHVNRGNQHDRRHGYADLLKYPRDYKVHWRMWNGGTTRFLLWGDPEYVARFAESAQVGGGDSYEVNEMLATRMLGEPHDSEVLDLLNPECRYYEYEFERYWYYYHLWGRVGYNPETEPDIAQRQFAQRFGEAGPHLQEGLHLASQVLPRIVSASYNYRLFPTTRGWAEMMRVYDLPQYAAGEGSDIQQFMNVRDAALSRIEGADTPMRRPSETSQWFMDVSNRIGEHIATAERCAGDEPSPEFVSTACDLRILAALSRYHSHRLQAGVSYNLFKETGDLFSLDDAIRLEENAVSAWRQIVDAAGDVYVRDLAFGVQRTGFSKHWQEELEKLEQGLKQLYTERQEAGERAIESELRITHIPVRRIEPSEPLMIRATVFGNETPAVLELLVTEKNGDAPAIERLLQMPRVAPNMYQVSIEHSVEAGRLAYRITSPETQASETEYVVNVSFDREPPLIEIDSAENATPGESFLVSAKVADPSGVKSVRLRYRHLTQYEDYLSADMKLDPETGLYDAEIPGDFVDASWDVMFFVEVVDNQGNGRMYPDLELEMPYIIVPTQ